MYPIRIGTCGWSYQDWSGVFYPEALPAGEYLGYYAERYPVVEVDSTYYNIDFGASARLWAERTPEGFLFDIKPFRLFTLHQTPHKMLPPLPIDGPDGTLAVLAGLPGRRLLVHINNTNPILIEGSRERAQVTAAGWEVAEDGMEIVL